MSEKKNISKKELRRRKRKRALMIKTGILCVLLVIFGIGIWALAGGTEKIQQKAQEKEDQKTAEVDGPVSSDSTGSAEAPTTKAQIMAEADALAQTYDYDGAIEKLQSVEGAATRRGYHHKSSRVHQHERCLCARQRQRSNPHFLSFSCSRSAESFLSGQRTDRRLLPVDDHRG